MKVYLCSRIAYDARPLNNKVAASLLKAGFEVYIPHEQAPNNPIPDGGRFDAETIFRLDYTAMQRSNVCVAVGRLGKDCAWELGWFYANKIPIIFVPGDDETWKQSPMTLPSLNKFVHPKPEEVGPFLANLKERNIL